MTSQARKFKKPHCAEKIAFNNPQSIYTVDVMDFLDPKKKRSQRRRLLIGYILIAIALALGTRLLALLSSGYYYDQKTGTIAQNGLVFASSKPEGADIYVNGALQSNKTNTKLYLTAKQYTVELKRKDYRTWSRNFSLPGGGVEHLDYPLLFPSNLQTKDAELYAAPPSFATASPDNHWLMVAQAGQIQKFDLVDLASDPIGTTELALPDNLLTPSGDTNQAWQAAEWSNDNRHVLLRHHFDSRDEFIVVDRESPTSSFNVNKLFKVSPSQVTLRDKKIDQLYIYTADGGNLQIGDVKGATLTNFLTHVLSFKSHDDKTVLFVSSDAKSPSTVSLKLFSAGNIYTMRELPANDTYLLDLARYNNKWYMAAAAQGEGRTYIYRDPEATLKQKTVSTSLLPAIVLNITHPLFLSISDTSQFIAVQSVGHFAVYDAESDRRFYYDLNSPVTDDSHAVWMDNSHLNTVSQGKILAFDFDGTNQQLLATSDQKFTAYLDHDSKWLYALGPSITVPGKAALTRTELVIK